MEWLKMWPSSHFWVWASFPANIVAKSQTVLIFVTQEVFVCLCVCESVSLFGTRPLEGRERETLGEISNRRKKTKNKR